MSRRLLVAGLAITAAGLLSVAHAQQKPADQWVLVGKGDVDIGKATETIDLSKAKGAYKAVRLVNRRGEIEILNVEVRFANGSSTNERRDIKLKAGERTKPIELKGDRFLENVTLSLKGGSGPKKGLVEVFALQSAEGAKMARPASGGQLAATPTAPQPTDAKPGTVTAGGEVLFGAQSVGFGIDRDTIKIGSEVGKFQRIRLRVLDNDIHLNELKVIYVSGDPDVLAVNADLKQNSATAWLPVKSDRFIREIQMSYRSRPNFKGQARVEVFGDYAANWLGPQGEGRKYNQGWVLLGAKPAGFVGFDNATIQVGRNEGGFKRIRVSVKDRAITLNEVRVVYANGSQDVIPVKARVDANSSFGPVDLKGGARAIKEIKATYRSRIFDKSAVGKGAALVEVWGQH
jgi:hypothetical protein